MLGRNAAVAAAILFLVASVGVLMSEARFDRQASHSDLIPVASPAEVLDMLRLGKRVLFVDAREYDEYEESRIPGAINITLRDVDALTQRQLEGADLVIAYCVKDFRGFEVARALRDVGVDNVRTLATPGLNGWQTARLPVFDPRYGSESDALRKLHECASQPIGCMGG